MQLKGLLALIFLCFVTPSLGAVNSFRVSQNQDNFEKEEVFLLSEIGQFQVIFEGHNWIYQEEKENNSIINFIDQAIVPLETRFNFYLKKLGLEFSLKFFYQDNITGHIRIKTIRFRSQIQNNKDIDSISSSEKVEELSHLKRSFSREDWVNWLNPQQWKSIREEALEKAIFQLEQWGDYQGAIDLTLEKQKRGYVVWKDLGSLYYKQGDYEKAFYTYSQSLKIKPEEDVLNKLVLLAMKYKDISLISQIIRYWILDFPSPPEGIYLMLLKFLIAKTQWDLAISWLKLYQKFYLFPQQEDQYTFLVARFYEAKSANQNIVLAIELYDKLLKKFPLSPFWKEGYERYLWLKGFYF